MSQENDGQGLFSAIVESIQAIAPGLSWDNIVQDVGAELGRLGVQGQMEMASALFRRGCFCSLRSRAIYAESGDGNGAGSDSAAGSGNGDGRQEHVMIGGSRIAGAMRCGSWASGNF